MTEDREAGGVVHRIFRRRAAERPGATALVHRGAVTTYRELDELSDTFAAGLAAAGVGAGAVVPLVMPRSPRLVATMLAVLKLGAAYAALDPRWPRARIEELAGLAAAPLLATSPDRAEGWSLRTWTPVDLPDAAVPPASPPVRETDTCCVFFTSGSTGQPKGVCSPHSGIVRLSTPSPSLHIGPDAVVPQAAPLPWDAMSLELWPALLNGGTSVLVDEPYLTTGGLRALVRDHGVNTVWLTASLFNLFVEEDPDCFTGVRQVLTGGERLSPPHVRRFLAAHPDIALWNGYGPVESTVFATTHRITPADCATDAGIPVGTPVPRTGVLVVDERLRPCPVGTTGEICVTGAGLANGYLADPEQTRRHFVDITVRGAVTRAYRTGDLGHLSAAGVLHHAGRIDRQVKIRGHRVEPGEIEARVVGIAGVRGCAVLPVRRGGPGYTGLVAAVTLTPTAEVTAADIADALRATLPPYLVPRVVRVLPELPLTANGKLDAAAVLEAVAGTAGEERTTSVPAPSVVDGAAVRDRVAAAFGEILGRAAVPPGVSLFELGGDSLDGARLCARIGAAVGIAVPASVLVRRPTVDGLVAWLETRTAPATSTPVPADGGRHRLLPMQAGFLFARLADPADVSAHCELHWRVRGDFDVAAFTAAVGEVHRRNQSLHAHYVFDREPVALTDRPPAPPEVRSLDAAPDWETAAGRVRAVLDEPLDIGTGRVWRCALTPVADGTGWLVSVVVHHIAFDGASARPLADQLGAAYAAHDTGPRPGTLAEVFAGYRAQTDEASLDEQRAYWRTRLHGVPPLAFPEPPDRGAAGPARDFRLAPAALAAVDRAAHRWASTRFAVLLATYAQALGAVSGQDDFAVGAPVAKRYHPATADAIGCLVDVVCFRFTPKPDAVPEALQAVHDGLAAQDVPFEEVVRLAADPARDRLRHPLFQTMFALQDESTAVLALDGCRVTPERPGTGRAVHELEVEVWPQPDGSAHVAVGHRPERVATTFAAAVAAAYRDLLDGFGRSEPAEPRAHTGVERPSTS
ncbi:non-ribosomal peptide synthetase [Umezawaea tangerina]|uniref:Amino acid adenylation domain-containing protein n=1 Tax=Umezawaea tangerina TaxID=84725 RepID=A0A2T0STR6_9PSEU|nr:non-ribosomal peptide synthetase [Umezawaea tangerina]PRY36805.1 amino acid adenylation domain-containing protein [Umezawaea tangerina]